MKHTYPESHGQVDCLTETEFEKLQEKIKNGEPLILPNPQRPVSA
jgi:hypothetical protein